MTHSNSVLPISISLEIKDALWILDDSSWVLDDWELLDKLSSAVALGTTWKSRKRWQWIDAASGSRAISSCPGLSGETIPAWKIEKCH